MDMDWCVKKQQWIIVETGNLETKQEQTGGFIEGTEVKNLHE